MGHCHDVLILGLTLKGARPLLHGRVERPSCPCQLSAVMALLLQLPHPPNHPSHSVDPLSCRQGGPGAWCAAGPHGTRTAGTFTGGNGGAPSTGKVCVREWPHCEVWFVKTNPNMANQYRRISGVVCLGIRCCLCLSSCPVINLAPSVNRELSAPTPACVQVRQKRHHCMEPAIQRC